MTESFRFVMLPPQTSTLDRWAERLAQELPAVRILRPADEQAAAVELAQADAAYGRLTPELLAHAGKLRWLQAPRAGPPKGFYFPELATHPVTVTNMRDTYTEYVATHAVTLLLGLARRLPRYAVQQTRGEWTPHEDGPDFPVLSASTLLVVGAGAIGSEVARLAAAFGMRVIGTDARRTEPAPGMAELHPAEELDRLLPTADFVVLAVPHTPQTEGLMDRRRLGLMKASAHLVNVGRGALVRLDDLVATLRSGRLAGVALDVFETEPLPSDHPLWTMPRVCLTPHVAAFGPGTDEQRFAVLLDNARRFASGQPLINVVDKNTWF